MKLCVVCGKRESDHPTPADRTPSGKFIPGLRQPAICLGCYGPDAPPADEHGDV